MTDFIEVTVPVLFWQDHVARDLPGGEVQAYKGDDVVIRMDRATYDELLSDAQHYTTMGASPWDYDWSYLDVLRESASITVARLKAVTVR
jgi:hypothetical protein